MVLYIEGPESMSDWVKKRNLPLMASKTALLCGKNIAVGGIRWMNSSGKISHFQHTDGFFLNKKEINHFLQCFLVAR